MAAIGSAVRLLSLAMMYKISNPKILNLVSSEEAVTLKMRRMIDIEAEHTSEKKENVVESR